jgi:ribosome-binding protein aMBF1 (putative translation factor)
MTSPDRGEAPVKPPRRTAKADKPAPPEGRRRARLEARRAFAAEVGRRVEAARIARRMTMMELARLARTGHPQIGRLERGANMPSLLTLAWIARALEVPMSSLADGAIPEPE